MTVKHLNQAELADRWDLSQRTLERWRAIGWEPCFLKIGGRGGDQTETLWRTLNMLTLLGSLLGFVSSAFPDQSLARPLGPQARAGHPRSPDAADETGPQPAAGRDRL